MLTHSNTELREAIEELLLEYDQGGSPEPEIEKWVALIAERERKLLTELIEDSVKYRLADGSPEPAIPVSVIEAKLQQKGSK